MRTITIVLACFACAGHGRRTTKTHEHIQEGSTEEKQNSQDTSNTTTRSSPWLAELKQVHSNPRAGAPKPLKVLAMLLALTNPAAAFGPSSPGLIPGHGHKHASNNPRGFRMGSIRDSPEGSGRLEIGDRKIEVSLGDSINAGLQDKSTSRYLASSDVRVPSSTRTWEPQRSSPEPRRVALAASAIVSTWVQFTDQFVGKNSTGGWPTVIKGWPTGVHEYDNLQMELFLQKLPKVSQMLKRMATEIKTTPPEEILGLVTKYGLDETDVPTNIFAVATVSKRLQVDHVGQLEEIARSQGLKEAGAALHKDGLVPVVDIENIVASPMPGIIPMDLVKELCLQIVQRAAASGHLVVLTLPHGGWWKYYREMGFQRVDGEHDPDTGRTLKVVYSKPVPKFTDNDVFFELGSLKVE